MRCDGNYRRKWIEAEVTDMIHWLQRKLQKRRAEQETPVKHGRAKRGIQAEKANAVYAEEREHGKGTNARNAMQRQL
jgi:hypothetical protein